MNTLSELAILTNKGKSTKDLVIQLLANEWPLTGKQIHNNIIKESKRPVSYQAVHKLINQLAEEEIIEKTDKGYQLKTKWINEVGLFANKLMESYDKNKKLDFEELWKKDYISITFNTLIDMGKFIIYNVFNYPAVGEKPSIYIERVAYPLVGFSKEDYKIMEKKFFKTPSYVVVASNTAADKYFVKIAQGFIKNLKGKLGIQLSNICDIFVCGDYIVNIFIDDKLLNKWKTLYNETTNFDEFSMKKYTDLIYNEKGELTITVQKNPVVADEMRKKVIEYFGGDNK